MQKLTFEDVMCRLQALAGEEVAIDLVPPPPSISCTMTAGTLELLPDPLVGSGRGTPSETRAFCIGATVMLFDCTTFTHGALDEHNTLRIYMPPMLVCVRPERE